MTLAIMMMVENDDDGENDGRVWWQQIVTALAIVSTLIPKSYFICDTASHIYFMISAYVFYRLVYYI